MTLPQADGSCEDLLENGMAWLEATRTKQDYQDLLRRVRSLKINEALNEVSGRPIGRGISLLLWATSNIVIDADQIISILSEDSFDRRAAAFCLIERFGSDIALFRDLLLAAAVHKKPSLDRYGSSHLVDLMGLSGKTHFAPLLLNLLKNQYHHHPPSSTAKALELLGIEEHSAASRSGRSITVSQSGSRLLIHNDDRFGGSSNCYCCKFFPCRVNHYYKGAIEDCKLWNKVDPESLLEIKDFRPASERDPFRDSSPEPTEDAAALLKKSRGLEAAGNYHAAAEVLRQGVRGLTDANEVLKLLTQAVRLLVITGDLALAYRLLELVSDKSGQADNELLLRVWDRTRLSLLDELGFYVDDGKSGARTPEGRIQARLLARLRQGPGSDLDELSSALSMLENHLQRNTRDTWFHDRWLGYLISYCHILGTPERAQKTIEILFRSPPKNQLEALGRQVFSARQSVYLGNPDFAAQTFREITPQLLELAPPNRSMECLVHAVEAEATRTSPDLKLALSWVCKIRVLFGQGLFRLTSLPARRRYRENLQYSLEVVLLALLRFKTLSPHEEESQAILQAAWELVSSTRNPELQRDRIRLSSDDAKRLSLLEDSLHRGLIYHVEKCQELEQSLRSGKIPEEVHSLELNNHRETFLRNFLRKVISHEMSHQALSSQTEEAATAPSLGPGEALMWFGFRFSLASDSFLLLHRNAGSFQAKQLSNLDETVFSPLLEYSSYLEAQATGGSPATLISREVGSTRRREQRDASHDPEATGRAAASILPPTILESRQEAHYLDLYPDALFYTLPLETLPDPKTPERSLGEKLALRYCLRPTPLKSAEKQIDLSRGWLGLGEIPPYDLLSSRQEIVAISELLQQNGILGVHTLLRDDAHLENLSKALEEHQPATLHLACHGHADWEYPDACALVLAPEPGGAAGPLLPFRLLRNLPLEGVELVVLAACESMAGPLGNGTGVQGLAWALMEAGVTYVLASRYSVSDRHTRRFMPLFYRNLISHSPAEALRRTRVEALRQEGFPLHEIGAWSLWC
ncbi:MAG: CHAT domain-containing protein [Deltaproteobacteria bacterium]|nr:CHAT domain-containing protein [Deltaproteobacteria bacterium]